MAVTPASLAINRPEFAQVVAARAALVTNFIAKAERDLCEEVLGDAFDDAVELHTCDQLARSPFARELRLVPDESITVYYEELERMLRKYGGAWRLYPTGE